MNIKLVLLHHGESIWNWAGKFTGWTDAARSEEGVAETRRSGYMLWATSFNFDLAHTFIAA